MFRRFYCHTELSDLRHLLGSSCDEMVSGNAALCFAHCLELEGIASNLLGTDIVAVLLRHAAADTTNTDAQKNAAIALGKLCRSEPRSLAYFSPLITSRISGDAMTDYMKCHSDAALASVD